MEINHNGILGNILRIESEYYDNEVRVFLE